MSRLLLICIPLIFCFQMAKSQFLVPGPAKQKMEAAINHIYNLKFSQADLLANQLQTEYPKHPGPYFLSALNHWWKIVLNENYQGFDSLMQGSLDTGLVYLAEMKNATSNSEELVFCEFLGWSLLSRLQATREKWTKSALTARKVISPLKKAKQDAGEQPEFLLPSGLYNYHREVIPNQFPIVKPFLLFFPSGDRILGLAQIEAALKKAKLTQGEAGYYLSRIYLDHEKDFPAALKVTAQMIRYFPENTYFHALHGVALYHNQQFLPARALLDSLRLEFEMISGHRNINLTSKTQTLTSQIMRDVYYFLGMSHIVITGDKDFKMALTCFDRVQFLSKISGFPDHELIAAAAYHSGVCYDNLDRREKAIDQYTKIKAFTNNEEYVEKAQNCLKSPCTFDF